MESRAWSSARDFGKGMSQVSMTRLRIGDCGFGPWAGGRLGGKSESGSEPDWHDSPQSTLRGVMSVAAAFVGLIVFIGSFRGGSGAR